MPHVMGCQMHRENPSRLSRNLDHLKRPSKYDVFTAQRSRDKALDSRLRKIEEVVDVARFNDECLPRAAELLFYVANGVLIRSLVRTQQDVVVGKSPDFPAGIVSLSLELEEEVLLSKLFMRLDLETYEVRSAL